MVAYYNEIDPSAAAWLRELIRRDLIAPGDVDERSIVDVRPDDLVGYRQCHFFAGIGVWSYALRQAGWEDSREVWTGSCPCQPFSAAGKGEGYADERHLWPHWRRLISECRPAVCFGEQVDAAIRTGWLDDVCLSLESLGYAIGAVSFPASSVGAPHIRQRLYFVADSASVRLNERGEGESVALQRQCPERGGEHAQSEYAGQLSRRPEGLRGTSSMADPASAERRPSTERRADDQHEVEGREQGASGAGERGEPVELGHPPQRGLGIDGRAPGDTGHPDEPEQACDMGDTIEPGLEGLAGDGDDGNRPGRHGEDATRSIAETGADGGMVDADRTGSGDGTIQRSGELGRAAKDARPSATNGFWSNAEWIACRDGKARPTMPGTSVLAHGYPARVACLRGLGNSIVAPQAQAFIEAYMSIEQ